MITVSMPADSVNPAGSRLTSFLATYPRFIHAEMMTHRAFSRNAASSRAIPFNKMLGDVMENPALPERWGSEQKGMQSGDEVEDRAINSPREFVKRRWIQSRDACAANAKDCAITSLHKSLCNRLIEPWSHITVLITASDKGFANFFALRAHPAAMPEFQVLAYRMLDLYMKSKPQEIPWGGWHIPLFGEMELFIPTGKQTGDPAKDHIQVLSEKHLIKIATARCARLSYLTHDGEYSPEKDIKLHDDLLKNRHLSPFEHCAKAVEPGYHDLTYNLSNFDIGCGPDGGGWEQYRKTIEGENQTEISPAAIMATKPDWITL